MMRKVNSNADDDAVTMTTTITEGAPSAPAVWLPPAVLTLISTLLALGGDPVERLLRYDRAAVLAGEWWRLLTGNFVHLGGWHLFLNGLSFVLLVFLCPERVSAREWLLRTVVIGTGMSLGLHFFVPSLATYVGLSGLVYGLFALAFVRQTIGGDRLAAACLAFLAARIVWELVIGAPASEEALIGGGVVAESHLYGAFAAVLYGAARGAFRRPAAAGSGAAA